MDLSDDDEAAAKAQFKGSFNINTQTGSEAEAAPSPLPSTESETVPAAMLDKILQDPTAEKLLSSINIETLSGISALTGKVPEPSVSPDLAPTPVPSTVPSPATPSPVSTYTRPVRPHQRPPGPRFRPRHHFEGGFPRRGGLMGPRFAPFHPPHPRMDRGGFRPR
ncbi:soluble scavenger receptor cysteine-rich domain-containing protein SSC5D-like isoform X2 [Diaphorina citri]|nr:soluble scavenger receptor cysteine-rich domain-containing protein SSC5D-like isoform X2 [Diaphorina citri]XP_008488107.1 soluble scavenger receptor cysteine-rich domain-containing protein SSC5D-like isoform X2 [Diaphorina citri]